jgi:hypothetical protein
VASDRPFDQRAPMFPDLVLLAFLLGTSKGDGKGGSLTLRPFDHVEELEFDHVGHPFVLCRTSRRLTGEFRRVP